MKSYFILGGGASSFFDPTQPDEAERFLNPGECRLLEETPLVLKTKKAEGITKLSEDEAKEYMSKAQIEALKNENNADKKLDKASKLNEEAKVIAQENKNLKQAKKDEEKAHEITKRELGLAKEALSDPELNPALSEAHDKIADLEKGHKALHADVKTHKDEIKAKDDKIADLEKKLAAATTVAPPK